MRKILLFFLTGLFFAPFCFSTQDPLPSWNAGASKEALMQFVQNTTNRDNKDYIPSEKRIATFDQDGTLWVEQPLYTQFVFAIDTIRQLEAKHPEWKNQEPYRTILEGNLEKIKQFSLQDIEKVIASSHSGITTTEFKNRVTEWLKISKHPKFNKPYTELVYQPMLELIQYLKDHEYKVYIVSGGGQDFIRAYSYDVYGIPPEQIIGSAGKTRYENRNGKSVLIKLPKILLIDDKEGKPEAIHFIIGKLPVAAFGNSDGDRQMLEWSQASDRKNLQLLIHHDDPAREYLYDTNSKIGTFSESLKEEALKRDWIIVSMKNDWKTIFPVKNNKPNQ